MSLSTAAEELPSTTHNALVGRAVGIHPSPLEAAEVLEGEGDERTALLGGGAGSVRALREQEESPSRGVRLQGWRRPSPVWIFVPIFIFTLLNGAAVAVEIEIFGRVACLSVPEEQLLLRSSSNQVMGVSELFEESRDADNFIAEALAKRGLGQARMSTGSPPANQQDEDWAARCRDSPAVQKATTAFMTKIMMLGGILAAATTGFWGGLSDRRGRVPLLAIATVGEICFALGTIALVRFPGLGMNFAYLGTACHGLLGGQMNSIIVSSAYLSDVTGSGSRAQLFATSEALQWGGVALGPVIGAILYRWTGMILLPLYGIASCRIIYLLLLILVVPESLSRLRRHDERRRAEDAALSEAHARLAEEDEWRKMDRSVTFMRTVRVIMTPLQALAPLAEVLPRRRNAIREKQDRPLLAPRRSSSRGRDWGLTCVALSFGLYMIVPGITGVKIVYARGKWKWGPEEVGYWITYSSICKLVTLVGLLPLAARVLRKNAPLPARLRPKEEGEEQTAWDEEAAHLKLAGDSAFDMQLVRSGILLTLIAYILMSLPNPSSTAPFLTGTLFLGLSGATTPALQSLALALASPRDAGKVLASLAVLSTLACQLVGPPIFGSVYIGSMDWWPEAVFSCACAWIVLSLVSTFFVKLVDDVVDVEEQRRRE